MAVGLGTSMRFLPNDSDPGLGETWVDPLFDDSAWFVGDYGVGFDTNPGEGAGQLIRSSVLPSGAALGTVNKPSILVGKYFKNLPLPKKP